MSETEISGTDRTVALQACIGSILDEVVGDWGVDLSRHPLKNREQIRFSADIGVLTHYVTVVPRYNAPTGTEHGWRVEWHSEAHEDAEIVENQVNDQFEAFRIAQEQMKRLAE